MLPTVIAASTTSPAASTTAMVPKAVVVGGSIAGLSCAHSLLRIGWRVSVLERSAGLSSSEASTGAGLGLDSQSLSFLRSWTSLPPSLTLPLQIDENRATDGESKGTRVLARDEGFGFRAAHWRDLHVLLYESLREGGLVLWGHRFLGVVGFEDGGGTPMRVEVKVLETGETVEMTADLLVGADGCMSAVRRCFLPDHKLRYSGYSAWRGVLDFSEMAEPETISSLRAAYPDLGNCLYFDLSRQTHCVLYELQKKRINWIWYVNLPEPHHKVSSVTMKVDSDMIEKMHKEAEKIWSTQLSNLIKETKDPFINVIYDSDPLPRLFSGNVVLVGDAAHPITPHGLRSTNMSILDAGVLAQCLQKWGFEKLPLALEEFQSLRLPVIEKQVLHSRHLGRLKQGLCLENQTFFDPTTAAPEEWEALLQKNMPFFDGVPTAA